MRADHRRRPITLGSQAGRSEELEQLCRCRPETSTGSTKGELFISIAHPRPRVGASANDKQGTSVADLLRLVIEKTGYEDHLRKTQPDFDSRWENVQELVRRPFPQQSAQLTGQISYSVIVAEEQFRESSGPISDEAFVTAASVSTTAAVEAAANQTSKRVHPMFRRTSTNNSTSTEGLDRDHDEEKPALQARPRKRRKADGTGTANGNGKVKEEPIDIVDSDDDLDSKPIFDTKSESPVSLSDQDAAKADVNGDE